MVSFVGSILGKVKGFFYEKFILLINLFEEGIVKFRFEGKLPPI